MILKQLHRILYGGYYRLSLSLLCAVNTLLLFQRGDIMLYMDSFINIPPSLEQLYKIVCL